MGTLHTWLPVYIESGHNGFEYLILLLNPDLIEQLYDLYQMRQRWHNHLCHIAIPSLTTVPDEEGAALILDSYKIEEIYEYGSEEEVDNAKEHIRQTRKRIEKAVAERQDTVLYDLIGKVGMSDKD